MPACSKESTNAEHKGGSRKHDKASSTKFLQALVSWRSGGIAPPACTSPLSLLSMASILSGAVEAMFLGIKKLTSQSFQHKSCENHMRPQQLTQETHDECYVILKLICYLGALTGMLDQTGLTYVPCSLPTYIPRKHFCDELFTLSCEKMSSCVIWKRQLSNRLRKSGLKAADVCDVTWTVCIRM